MKILAIDGARRTGWAYGVVGKKPYSDTWELRPASLSYLHGAVRLGKKIRDACFVESERPDLIVFEAPMPIFSDSDERGERGIKRTSDSLAQPPALATACALMAELYGLDWHQVHPATWRKHFLGKANFGSKRATKEATVQRCKVLGYIPRDAVIRNKESDPLYDRADAIGIWSWACGNFGGYRPTELVLFGER